MNQAIAKAWAQVSAAGIVLVGRKAETLNLTVDNITKISKSIPLIAEPTDVSDESSVKSLFAKVKAKFGKAHVLVNAAGSMGGGMVGDVPLASWGADFVSNFLRRFSTRDSQLTHHLPIGDQRQWHLSPSSIFHPELRWRRNHYQFSQYWRCSSRSWYQLLRF